MKYYGLDLTSGQGIVRLPLKHSCLQYDKIHADTYLMNFDSEYGKFKNDILFLQPFKFRCKITFDIAKVLDIRFTTRSLHVSENILNRLDVNDTYLFECYWDIDYCLKTKQVIYNISKKKMMSFPDWMRE